METQSRMLKKAKALKARAVLYATELDRIVYPRYFKDRLSPEEANLLIYRSIKNSSPLMAGKLGSVETRILGEFRYKQQYSRKTIKEAHQNAGVFPASANQLDLCAIELWQSLQSIDLLGCWPVKYQARLSLELRALPKRCEMPDLEPFFYKLPWTHALRDKKVCIVHPFVATMQEQWHKREKLFENPSVLPAFEPIFIKSPMTIAGSSCHYPDWATALDSCWQEIRKQNFDVALIGCGAYSLPLAMRIKAMGKPCIHLGGSLQLLFGIFGKRWETFRDQKSLQNEHWVRPLACDRPNQFEAVEGGCYW
jgi:hypothetical protein